MYDLGNGYVIKIAKSKNGISCNHIEVNIYNSLLKPIKKYLAKIKEYHKEYHWIAMKKYDRKFPVSSNYKLKLKKLVKTFRANGIIPSKGIRHYYKPHAPNIRLKRGGQIVIIDYGGFKYDRK
ncbi:hypothetical protein QFZ77_004448 [Paenibacillus sp. V4I3]|uniref:hypothetical protein n=1 Tax=unclassified Paenibacillus TaxID=185978 RepID=UPI0027873FC5|nr:MULTISPECIES: hypothetical protein [unclassified Paenibacillus]MDQ0875789.1 hypothetical protein [Paenibacillus sp. V4I3]MDQ0888140.1 hypothetical protein [Paenibacillus sp. V4I9]